MLEETPIPGYVTNCILLGPCLEPEKMFWLFLLYLILMREINRPCCPIRLMTFSEKDKGNINSMLSGVDVLEGLRSGASFHHLTRSSSLSL